MLCGQIGGWFATRAAERRSYLASSCQNLPLATPHTSLNFQTTRRCQVTPSLSSVWKSTESQTFEVLAEACRISDPGRQGGLRRIRLDWRQDETLSPASLEERLGIYRRGRDMGWSVKAWEFDMEIVEKADTSNSSINSVPSHSVGLVRERSPMRNVVCMI